MRVSRRALAPLLVLLAGCGQSRDAAPSSRAVAGPRSLVTARPATATEPTDAESCGAHNEAVGDAAQNLSIASSNAVIGLLDSTGSRMGGFGACPALHERSGSYSYTDNILDDEDTTNAAGPASRTIMLGADPGERFLLDVVPDSTRPESLQVTYRGPRESDFRLLSILYDGVAGRPFRYLIRVDSLRAASTAIGHLEVPHRCGIVKEIRNGSDAELDLDWRLRETGEHGTLHVGRRESTTEARVVRLTTTTHGTLVLSLLSRELAVEPDGPC